MKHNKINWPQAQSFKAWQIATSLIFTLCKKIAPARQKSLCWQLKKQPPPKHHYKILLHVHRKPAGCKARATSPSSAELLQNNNLMLLLLSSGGAETFLQQSIIKLHKKPERQLPHVKYGVIALKKMDSQGLRSPRVLKINKILILPKYQCESRTNLFHLASLLIHSVLPFKN